MRIYTGTFRGIPEHPVISAPFRPAADTKPEPKLP